MDFNEFKEQFTEDVKQGLADAGIDAKISINTVEKMNETYEAMTVTPEGSNVGVNVNMEKIFGNHVWKRSILLLKSQR